MISLRDFDLEKFHHFYVNEQCGSWIFRGGGKKYLPRLTLVVLGERSRVIFSLKTKQNLMHNHYCQVEGQGLH